MEIKNTIDCLENNDKILLISKYTVIKGDIISINKKYNTLDIKADLGFYFRGVDSLEKKAKIYHLEDDRYTSSFGGFKLIKL